MQTFGRGSRRRRAGGIVWTFAAVAFGLSDLAGTRRIYLDDEMHAHYSTVSGAEMTNAVALVIDLATFPKAHENAAHLLAAFPTSLSATRV